MITFRVLVEPLDGHAEEARQAARGLREAAMKNPGVVDLNFFDTDVPSQIAVIEIYRDSDALLEHIRQAPFGSFSQLVKVTSVELYGAPTPEARAMVENFGPVTFCAPV